MVNVIQSDVNVAPLLAVPDAEFPLSNVILANVAEGNVPLIVAPDEISPMETLSICSEPVLPDLNVN